MSLRVGIPLRYVSQGGLFPVNLSPRVGYSLLISLLGWVYTSVMLLRVGIYLCYAPQGGLFPVYPPKVGYSLFILLRWVIPCYTLVYTRVGELFPGLYPGLYPG